MLVDVYWLSDGSEPALGATINPDESFSIEELFCEAGFGAADEPLGVELPEALPVEFVTLLGAAVTIGVELEAEAEEPLVVLVVTKGAGVTTCGGLTIPGLTLGSG